MCVCVCVYTHHHATILANVATLFVHQFDGVIPLLHALAVAGQIEASDCHLAGYNRVYGGPAISHHEQEFGLQEIYIQTNKHIYMHIDA